MSQFHGGFSFPLINTSIHMIIKLIISRLWFFNGFVNAPMVKPISNRMIWVYVVLIGLCTAGDVALSNVSILFISLTLYTTIKATVLVFTFLWGILLGIEKFKCN